MMRMTSVFLLRLLLHSFFFCLKRTLYHPQEKRMDEWETKKIGKVAKKKKNPDRCGKKLGSWYGSIWFSLF